MTVITRRVSRALCGVRLYRVTSCPLLEIKDFGPPASGGHGRWDKLKCKGLFTSHCSLFTKIMHATP